MTRICEKCPAGQRSECADRELTCPARELGLQRLTRRQRQIRVEYGHPTDKEPDFLRVVEARIEAAMAPARHVAASRRRHNAAPRGRRTIHQIPAETRRDIYRRHSAGVSASILADEHGTEPSVVRAIWRQVSGSPYL